MMRKILRGVTENRGDRYRTATYALQPYRRDGLKENSCFGVVIHVSVFISLLLFFSARNWGFTRLGRSRSGGRIDWSHGRNGSNGQRSSGGGIRNVGV
jgi:uncharacterized membrane protein YgcG